MSAPQTPDRRLWGILAEYPDASSLVRAADALGGRRDVRVDAYSPFPVEGLSDSLRQPPSRLPWAIFAGGLVGGSSMYGLQYWINLYAYPLNIGGRPLHSWPSFIPPTFELTVLTASFVAFFGVLVACRLPRLHHPLFEIEDFKRVSQDAFFLTIEFDIPEAPTDSIEDQLRSLGATSLWEVPDA